MISALLTTILIILFFFLQFFTPAIKKALGLITKTLLKILNLFCIKIERKETSIKVSEDFKSTYKEIKTVKLAKKNIKQKSSIDWLSVGILIVSLLLFGLNMQKITNFAISNWLFSWISKIPLINKMFATESMMYTYYTAILFSVMSFALSKLLARWKETKQQRIELKQMKIKLKTIDLMTSKELLDSAKKKDEIEYKKLKGEDKDGTNT